MKKPEYFDPRYILLEKVKERRMSLNSYSRSGYLSEKDKQILYLARRKYPAIYEVNGHIRLGNPSQAEGRALMEEVKAYVRDLGSKAPEELKELYANEVRQASLEERKYQAERARLEEQNHFFNQPSANADFNHWGKMAYWTAEEAIALSFGKSPKIVSWKEISFHKNSSPFVKNYMKVQELVQRALAAKELNHESGPYGSQTKRIKPFDFINWAKRNGIAFPLELEKIILERESQSTDWEALCKEKDLEVEQLKKKLEYSQNKRKELVAKARASTNSSRIPKMALAVIAEDKYKYGKESSAIGSMLSYFDKQGFNIDDQTLRNHIDEGLSLLKGRKTSV